MKRLLLLILVLFAAACTTTKSDQQRSRGDYGRRGADERGFDAAASPSAMLPPGAWWRDPQYARGMSLRDEQLTKLDAIESANLTELDKVRREISEGDRAIRTAMAGDTFDRAAFDAAAAQVSEARGKLLARQLRVVADTREVLDRQQWKTLQDTIAERRTQRYERRPRGGMYPGMGPRRPGGGPWGW